MSYQFILFPNFSKLNRKSFLSRFCHTHPSVVSRTSQHTFLAAKVSIDQWTRRATIPQRSKKKTKKYKLFDDNVIISSSVFVMPSFFCLFKYCFRFDTTGRGYMLQWCSGIFSLWSRYFESSREGGQVTANSSVNSHNSIIARSSIKVQETFMYLVTTHQVWSKNYHKLPVPYQHVWITRFLPLKMNADCWTLEYRLMQRDL